MSESYSWPHQQLCFFYLLTSLICETPYSLSDSESDIILSMHIIRSDVNLDIDCYGCSLMYSSCSFVFSLACLLFGWISWLALRRRMSRIEISGAPTREAAPIDSLKEVKCPLFIICCLKLFAHWSLLKSGSISFFVGTAGTALSYYGCFTCYAY